MSVRQSIIRNNTHFTGSSVCKVDYRQGWFGEIKRSVKASHELVPARLICISSLLSILFFESFVVCMGLEIVLIMQ